MGPHETVTLPNILFSFAEDGTILKSAISGVKVFKDDVFEASAYEFPKIEPMEFKIKAPKQKSSRKAFKKWLMAHGISRDDAEWYCWLIQTQEGRVSYRDIFRISLFLMREGKLSGYDIFTSIIIKGANANHG